MRYDGLDSYGSISAYSDERVSTPSIVPWPCPVLTKDSRTPRTTLYPLLPSLRAFCRVLSTTRKCTMPTFDLSYGW